MEITLNNTVGEIIAQNANVEAVFEAYDIDICTDIDVTLAEIMNRNIAPDQYKERLITSLKASSKLKETELFDVENEPLNIVIKHILEKHHLYIEEKIPVIKEHLSRIVEVHGDNHPELLEVQSIFNEASGELAMHLKKEELILFPYINKLAKAAITGTPISKPKFQSISIPIAKMDAEHDDEEKAFETIATLTHNYSVPEDGCGTYAVALSMLKEFESDLKIHIKKENDHLFKRAEELEHNLTQNDLIL